MWYLKNKEDIYKELNSNEKGLSTKQINDNLIKYGKNELPKKKKENVFQILLRQTIDPMIVLLIITVIFSLIIKEYTDAITIIFIIIIDLILGTFQEWKAEKNAESLMDVLKIKTIVLRENKEIEIDANDLVVGDIVLIESGNKISADLRILESQNLTIDESILTGESLGVNKNGNNISKEEILSEHFNIAYAGTSVLTGRAKCIVIEVGINTEIGKIANTVSNTKEEKSPLTIRMAKFSKQISVFILGFCFILVFIYLFKGIPGAEIFPLVIALTVSAMPEGLPLALTMVLTIASNRMFKKNVIVKKLTQVESLGSCTVIASDKTGTLTVNEQTAKKVLLPSNDVFDITGSGYNDAGKITGNEDSFNEVYQIGMLGMINNEASLTKNADKWNYHGDSIDIAFLSFAKKLKIKIDDYEILKKIPYESENKYSAVFYQKNNQTYCTVKGSLEKVLEFSKTMGKDFLTIDKDKLSKQNAKMASLGYRVIAIASGIVKNSELEIPPLNFWGLVGFIDPIRHEAKKAILECKKAGIEVLMITGDHPLTAYSIGKDLNLLDNYDQVTNGTELEDYLIKGKKEFDDFIKDKTVFARVTPLNKLSIIESYKRRGEFIAVTGDGVNDAPAIKSAHIGISMGSGTDVAKETSSMIIIDDNFSSIITGIKEGRTAYSNIRKVILMLVSCGIAEVLFFVLSLIFNLPLPLIAIQLLWLNIVTDGLQDIALAFEKSEEDIMDEKPKAPSSSIFDKNLVSFLLISGLSFGLIIFGVWVYLIKYINMDIYLARSYIMLLMVFMQNMHVLNCRSEKKSAFKMPIKSNPLVILTIVLAIALQIIITEIPFLNQFLQVAKIPIQDIIILLFLSSIIILVLEIHKNFKRKKNSI